MTFRRHIPLGALLLTLCSFEPLSPQTEIDLGQAFGDGARDLIWDWWRTVRPGEDLHELYQAGVRANEPIRERLGLTYEAANRMWRAEGERCAEIEQEVAWNGLRTTYSLPNSSADVLIQEALAWAAVTHTGGEDRIQLLEGATPRLIAQVRGKSPAFDIYPFFDGYFLVVEAREGRVRITVGRPSTFDPDTGAGALVSDSAGTGLGALTRTVDSAVTPAIHKESYTPGVWLQDSYGKLKADIEPPETNELYGLGCLSVRQYQDVSGREKVPSWVLTSGEAEGAFSMRWSYADSLVAEYAEMIGNLTKALNDSIWRP